MNKTPRKPLVAVGDHVEINDHGMRIIGGITSKKMMKQALSMKITEVDPNSLTPEGLYNIEVDQPLIRGFLLTDDCVDKLPKNYHQTHQTLG